MSKDKKHILLLSSWYPTPNQPFVGNFVKRQAELLASNYKVSVLHSFVGTTNKIEITTPTDDLTEILIEYPQGKNPISKWKQQKKAFFKGVKHLEKSVDLIISQIAIPKGRQFHLAKKHFNCPWIHLESGSYVRREWSITEKIIARPISKYSDKILVPSKFIQSEVERKFNRKCAIFPYHHFNKIFKFKKTESSTTRFLHISTLDEKTKNPKGIFDAFALALKQNPDLHLQIVCDESFEKWKDYCREIEIDTKTSFEGPKDWEELPSFYHNADAFILNSDYETFSIVLAESWATGTPTLTTSVGIGYNIDKILGMNHQIGNPESLANNILEFARTKDKYDGNKISQFAQQFSEENVLFESIKLINETIG